MVMPTKLKRFNVLGVGVNAVDMEAAVAYIWQWIESATAHYVCLATVYGIMECQQDENLKLIFNESGLTLPDGMPLVWAGRGQGFSPMGRVYGPDLMLEICRGSVEKGYTHFLYGGKEGVAPQLKLNLEKRFPGIKIIGTYTPPFRPLNQQEANELRDQVARLRPDFFWVGISSPKQERYGRIY